MDAAKITYIEEANELLINLERSLLALEQSTDNKSSIEEVFRVMHTLKGNSSMFGLPVIADFVHDLETIYDKVRSNEMILSKALIDHTFLSLDHLKNIILDPHLEDNDNKTTHEVLIAKVTALINNKNEIIPVETVKSEVAENIDTYHIYFEPSPSVFHNGTNPLFLLAELSDMGKCKCIPHFKDPVSFDEYDTTHCGVYWDIFLETSNTVNEIKDVFVFVEDSSIIKVDLLPKYGYLTDAKFLKFIQSKSINDEKISLTDFVIEKQFITPSETEVIRKKTETKEKSASSIRVSSEKLDELMNLVSELVTTQAGLTLFSENNKSPELETISENIEKLSRRLRDMAFGMTLVPINNLFGRFQRMVRDTSAQLGKKIDFITEGGETELDKTIIETLTDPLMHILRNSLDHGIETPEDRLKKGKTETGKLTLKSYYSGVFVYIQIIDDGKGIDVEAVREKAISKNLIKEEDSYTNSQLFEFIFHPGFSTAKKVTDVSGRGVGMDVVKRNISDIKGTIAVESEVNKGTILTIKLPLTLSIIDGLLVQIAQVNYIIPLSVITKCFEIDSNDMIDNFNQLLILDEEQVPFINTREEFGLPLLRDCKAQIIVVNNGDRKVGISVDHITGEHQAVVKPLGKFYKNQDFMSGASILGDGTIALVLDTTKIIELQSTNIKN